MAPRPKLTYQQLKTIRRRNSKGEHLTVLALEYEVNRKTLRRRLDALAQAETERAQRITAKRLRRQAAAERQATSAMAAAIAEQRSAAALSSSTSDDASQAHSGARVAGPTKQLQPPRRRSASGLVRVGNPGGSIQQWVEPALVDGLLEQGWTLA